MVYGYNFPFFYQFYKGEQFFRLPVCFHILQSPSKRESTLGKIIAPRGQIPFFKSGPPRRGNTKIKFGRVASPIDASIRHDERGNYGKKYKK